MRIVYLLLSPTFGMHQYTADLANRMAGAGHDVHLITTVHHPRDRYTPAVTVHTPVDTADTGLSPGALSGLRTAMRRLRFTIRRLEPDVVHLTGPHLWNVLLLRMLRREGVPTVHTLHDLDPHSGTAYGSLLHAWNGLVLRWSDHILLHGDCYRERLLARGYPPRRLTCFPLLHLFLGHTWLEGIEPLAAEVRYEPCALFFGRLERYKGVDHLITAWAMIDGNLGERARLVLAGPGALDRIWAGALPPRVEVRNHLVQDREALELFRRCGLLVLPYLDATQSALVAAAYFFRKPVIVSRTGALPEYVHHGETGWVTEPDHPASLARYMRTALADPARLAGMGAAGRAWYDTQRTAEERMLQAMYARLGQT